MGGAGLDITAAIDGRSVPRSEVLAWEARRAARVCKKLGIVASPDDLVAQREALVARKLELGHDALERLLARELRWSERGSQLIARLSRGRRRLCTVELTGTGGSPLATRILLDDSDTSTVTTRADPAFPVQWVAVGGTSSTGPPTGAIRHQFRDEPNGFKVRLTGEFPAATPPYLIRAHRWHLACEFSNWIEAANTLTS